jgi:hypothetical protein
MNDFSRVRLQLKISKYPDPGTILRVDDAKGFERPVDRGGRE